VPDHLTRQALIKAARRGVQVRLLLPRKTDVPIARWAAHGSYARLLAAGVHIYEYLPRVLHAKVVLIDRRWAAVGTANIDYRSFFVNYELNLITADAVLCHDLQQQFEQDLLKSEQVQTLHWAQRPWLHRLAETLAWFIRRWL
jgi:cardiolipin synthase